ncbi:hypothetical protein CIB48_g11140 [Xylaria polymorpha]|nr:hypothetical protein CIB48_g11140 [Xylaria polymorpha]
MAKEPRKAWPSLRRVWEGDYFAADGHGLGGPPLEDVSEKAAPSVLRIASLLPSSESQAYPILEQTVPGPALSSDPGGQK